MSTFCPLRAHNASTSRPARRSRPGELTTLAAEFATILDGAVGTGLFCDAVRVRRTGGRLGLLALERFPEFALGLVL